MKKLLLFLTLIIVGFTANAQFSPSNNLNYIKLLKNPPIGKKTDSVMVFDGTDKFVKMIPKSEVTEGKEDITNKTSVISGYSETLYPNEKATHDALDAKLNLSDLPSNLTLYATNVPSGVSTYTKWVASLNDPDYNTTAVDIPTGAISGTAQLISGLSSIGGQIIGNPGIINVTTVGNIRRTSGTGTAKFYFELYKRTSAGVETLLGVSDFTLPVDFNTYSEFSATAVWNDGVFTETDRIVIKFYGSRIAGGGDPTFDFQFGGLTPVRTIVPVPFRVVAGEYEVKTNKQNSLSVDGTGIKYPTVDATNAGLFTKIDGTQDFIDNNFHSFGSSNTINTGWDNTALGYRSLSNGLTVSNNIAIGYESMLNTTSTEDNTAIGFRTLYNLTSGIRNVAIGNSTLLNHTSGSYNVGVGFHALFNSSVSSDNTAIGYTTLGNLTTGVRNTSLGFFSLLNLTTTNDNIGIGHSSGRLTSTITPNTTASNSIFIGNNSKALTDADTNQIVIGNDAIGKGSNTVQIGNSSILDNYLFGRLNFTNSGSSGVSNGLFLTNNATSSGSVLYVDNLASGRGISVNTTSTGRGLSIFNSGTGQASYFTNSSTGNGILLANSGTGTGLVGSNSSSGIFSNFNNTSTGIGYVINSTATSTSDLMQFRKNNINTTVINSLGHIYNPKTIINSAVDNGIDLLQVNGTISASPATLSNQVPTFGQVFTSPTFTGVPSVPTATTGTNTTQIASTAFVQANVNANAVLLTGDQSITGEKVINKTPSVLGRLVLNNSSSSNIVNSTNSGGGSHTVNVNSNGTFFITQNNSILFSDNTNNASAGIFNQNSNNSASSFNYNLNTSTGRMLENVNFSTGILNYNNSLTGSTGDLEQYLKAGTVTAKINHLGEITAPKLTMTGTIELKGYTVATLPTGVEGATAYVTDAIAPIYLGALTGGGTVKCPVFFDGTVWRSTIDATDVVRNIAKDATQGANVTGTVSETILYSKLIPAGTFKDGDFMTLFSRVAKSLQLGTLFQRVRINTSNTLTGSILIGSNFGIETNRIFTMSRTFTVSNGFLTGFSGTVLSASDVINNTTPAQFSVFDPTVDNYIFITGQLSNALDTMFNLGTKITN